MRGDIVRRKKELLAELANLESLEEPMFWMGCCMQEKVMWKSNCCIYMRKRDSGIKDLEKDGCCKGMLIQSFFIKLLMAGLERKCSTL